MHEISAIESFYHPKRRYPSMPCRSPGPHPGGRLRGLAGRGSPGPHPGRVCIPACTEADTALPQQTATAAGGMHPTGMHSFLYLKLNWEGKGFHYQTK